MRSLSVIAGMLFALALTGCAGSPVLRMVPRAESGDCAIVVLRDHYLRLEVVDEYKIKGPQYRLLLLPSGPHHFGVRYDDGRLKAYSHWSTTVLPNHVYLIDYDRPLSPHIPKDFKSYIGEIGDEDITDYKALKPNMSGKYMKAYFYLAEIYERNQEWDKALEFYEAANHLGSVNAPLRIQEVWRKKAATPGTL